MPPLGIAVIAYCAGLAFGFVHAWIAGVVGAIAMGVWRALRADRTGMALALLVAAGVGVGFSTARDDRQCVDVLRRRNAWRVALDDSASPGAFVRARALDCHADVAIAVAKGNGAAGDEAIVRGDPLPDSRGLLMRDATVRAVASGSVLERWRFHASLRVDAVFGEDAPLAKALLLADKRGIPTEMRDRYAAAGMAHLLAISGFHVLLIAVALRLLFGLVRLSRQRADLATFLTLLGYVALIGAPAGALRAVAMFGVALAARLLQRPISGWATLAAGTAFPLADPRVLGDVGFQLSVTGVAALIATGALARRITWLRDARGILRHVALSALACVVATMVTGPLTAWHFGRISTVGWLTTLGAVPVMALVQPILFLALIASPIVPLAHFVADAAHPLLRIFDGIATMGANLPGASLDVAPSTSTAILAGVVAATFIVGCVTRHSGRAAVVGAIAIALIVWWPLAAPVGRFTELHMIDVGQGDAIALRTSRGRWVLVDAGRIWHGGDAGRSTIIPYLAHRGGSLVAFILTHPHDDHVGGAASVIRALRPTMYYDAAYSRAGLAYRASLIEAERDGVSWRRVRPGDSLVVDEAVIHFLGPDSAWTAGLRDANAASTIALVTVGSVRILLVGDAERGEEEWLLHRDAAALRADVLKVGHHGSSTSTTDAFLSAVGPRLALVSVGAGNSYGLPSADVMRRLGEAGATVMRTDRVSTVVVRTDGQRIEAEAGDIVWPVPSRRDRQ